MNEKPLLQESDETAELIRQAAAGDRKALDELFSLHRVRLRRMAHLRLASPLRGRVDASDVVQEAYLEAAQRLPEYARDPQMPFFLWLRFLTRQKLLALHRHHVGTRARDPRREVAIYDGPLPEATSHALAAQLLGQMTSPSATAIRAEVQAGLQRALDSLEPDEREVLALRHFESLSNAEAARELGLSEAAASKRYIRALARLKGILQQLKMDPGRSGF